MLNWLGVACLLWTAYEVMGLLMPRRPSASFEAWDQNGRAVRVEEVRFR